MKTSDTEAVKAASTLVRRALAGALTLDEYHYAERPTGESPPLVSFLKKVYLDIEEAVEHTPGRWLRHGVNHERWRHQVEYHRMELDNLLLDHLGAGGSVAKAVIAYRKVSQLLRDGESSTSYIRQELSTSLGDR